MTLQISVIMMFPALLYSVLSSDRSDKMINLNIIEMLKQTTDWLQFSVISDSLISGLKGNFDYQY